MKGLLLSLFLVSSHPSMIVTPATHSSEWTLNGELANQCVLATLGNVHDERGAQITIQCDSDSPLTGNVLLKLSATHLQYKRVTITANIQHDEQLSSTLWIKSSRASRTLFFETDSDDMLLNASTSSGQRSITSAVAGDAEMVSMGVMLHGKGVVTLRNVHVSVSVDDDISPQAQHVLDRALEVIRQHTARNMVEWDSLAAHAQQLASGAKQSADVYPVIRYVLNELGDKRSLLLTPQTSRALSQHSANSPATILSFYTLPDGAELALNTAPLVDQRIADRWP